MHVVIVGCGRLGNELTVSLAREGHTVAVIDKRPEAFERLPPGFEGQTLVGIGFDRETLEEAGINDAGAFLAVTNGDNSNIVATRIAREHYKVEKVVARINDPRRADIYRKLGIPTVADVRWAKTEILDALFHGMERAEFSLGSGALQMLAVDVPPSKAGTRVLALNDPGMVTVVAVGRMGEVTIPKEDTTFHEGDTVHVLVQREAVPALQERLNEEPHA